ncbi:MAG TPA: RNA polymerase sigma factor [Thermoanaerobaculia bacterium]|nr:RNA polymerase sigma factor [Thermoanaerobaculia bacterium]
MESARIVAGLARLVGDVGRAEDFAQDALLAALERWSESGVPDNPGAWLAAVARRRAIDQLRRRSMAERKHRELAVELAQAGTFEAPDAEPGEAIEDEVLRLIFICCHPVLSTEARVALTLRLVGGLTTEEIARAFLVPVSTLAQRVVRAKRTLREARVPFQLPPEAELPERLASVLEVVYLVFNEGYAATSGEDWIRPELCRDALRLGRILAELAPAEPEAHGLVALMELHASRLAARIGPEGEAVLLMDQDRSRWDRLHIGRGLDALRRSQVLGGGLREALGPYTLQAAIAACHARAVTPEETDWVAIAALYDALAQLVPSPVVELNRAVAISRAFGPTEGLELVDGLVAEGALDGYHLLRAVRGDLLEQLGRQDEARAEFTRAAEMAGNERERALLRQRAGERGPGRV